MVNTRNHIVQFSSKPTHQKQAEVRPLPVLIKQLQQVCIEDLESKLLSMLNTADDRLFDMAETSYNNAQFDAMRLLRVKREGLLTSFKQEMHNNFSQCLGTPIDDSLSYSSKNEDNVETLSFENIALVKDDDLEENIATDAMVNKAKTKNRDALEHIRTRMDAIIADKSIEELNNPLEPLHICEAFRFATHRLDLDIESLLVIYKLFDRSVVSELASLYQKANDFFIDKGILPDLKISPAMAKRANSQVPANNSQSLTTPAANTQDNQRVQNSANQQDFPTAIMQESAVSANPNASVTDSSPYQTQAKDSAELFSLLQGLIANARQSQMSDKSGYVGGSASNHLQNETLESNDLTVGGQSQIPLLDGVEIETPQLLNALSTLQQNIDSSIENFSMQQQSAGSGSNLRKINLKETINQNLAGIQGIEENVSLGQFNEDMIDIVSMLFDFILEDDHLSLELKGVIARLQIPMLKVGLVDKNFFSDRRHPARLLLNELGHAGLSWDAKDPNSQLMYKKISEISSRIIDEFVDNVDLFSELLTDFMDFKQKSLQRSRIFEKRTKEAEEGKARTETARDEVNKALKAICEKQTIPPVARTIFKKVWSHVLLLDKLRSNEAQWQMNVKVAKLLVWSLRPIETAEQIEKLTSKVPILVKAIQRGIDAVSISPIDSTKMLEDLEDNHREIIQKCKERINQESEEEVLRLPALDTGFDLPIESYSSDTSQPTDFPKSSLENEPLEEEAIEEVVIEDIGFSSVETGRLSKEKMTEPIPIDSKSKEAVEQLRAGSWVELQIDGEFKRSKLAAKIVNTGKYIFVNRSGMKMAEYLTHELCACYQQGKLKILDDEALFDRALESVISNLRSMKAQA